MKLSNRVSAVSVPAALVCIAIATSGCATVKMNETKVIETRHGFLETPYKQDGKSLDLQDMQETLEKLPASKASAEKSSTFRTLGLVTGIPGGFMLGWYLGTDLSGGEASPALLYAGLPLTALSLVFELIAKGHLEDAINAHNKSLSKSAEREPPLRWSPVLAAGEDTLVGGVRVAF